MSALNALLQQAMHLRASDLHLTTGRPPVFRVYGSLRTAESPPLSAAEIRAMVDGILDEGQRTRFERDLELDLAFSLPGVGRFRTNVHRQRGNVEAAFRTVPLEVPSLRRLGVPPVVDSLCDRPAGLVLVTGPAGVGKSTTLAAMVDRINETRNEMVITIEDPIEYVHGHKGSLVKQREVGFDTRSFAEGLRHVLRQDPDVIMIGEMRDLETVATALTAAETGHLVLSTLHTPDAPQSIDRLVDVFPPHQQDQVYTQLASVLEGIVSQQLIPRKDGQGLALATQVLVATPAVRTLIREHKTSQLESVTLTGAASGMHTMDQSLERLYRDGIIGLEVALAHARAPERLRKSLETEGEAAPRRGELAVR